MKKFRFRQPSSRYSLPGGQDFNLGRFMRFLEVSCWCVTVAGLAVLVAVVML